MLAFLRDVVLASMLVHRALGHGALAKPIPRKVSGRQWMPWGVGEHQPQTNPYGAVHHEAMLSHPCGGSSPGDAPYLKSNYAGYQDHAEPGETSYAAGGTLNATIVLDADHNGEAQWAYCPHSQEQTEECFRSRPLTGWVDVHSYWDATNTVDHWKTGQTYPQTVSLPADMSAGPATLRWLWICKWTDEIFASCFDTSIVNGSPAPAPSPLAAPDAAAACVWTDPPGRTVERTARDQKEGRVCWDFKVEPGTTVYYQSKTDIYTHWNADSCCLQASRDFGSKDGGEANIVSFTSDIDNFGFCECTAWDPSDPGSSCAGSATADEMRCPVLGATDRLCPAREAGSSSDGIAYGCTPAFSGPAVASSRQPEPEPEPEPEPAPADMIAASSSPQPGPESMTAPAPTSFCCTWSSVPHDCGVCESKSGGWCSDSAGHCSMCGSTAFYCPVVSMRQRSFLAPVKRSALHQAPMLVQSKSVLRREWSLINVSSDLQADDEL
jgi:hypothetical protein